MENINPRLQKYLRLRDYCLLEVLYSTGCRVSEVVAMTHPDMDIDAGTIFVVGKGRKERLVMLSSSAIEAYRSMMESHRMVFFPTRHDRHSDRVFRSKSGKPLDRATVASVIKSISRLAGIKKTVTPHTIRHSFATHMIEGGTDVSFVSRLLGHESLATTSLYIHLSTDVLRDAHRKIHH